MDQTLCESTTSLATLEVLSSRPWMNVEVPAEVLAVPTMLSYRERQLLYWLARHHFTGFGRIVDGGCFLGGSTAALASGLADRGDGSWEQAIASYDLFRVEDYTLASFGNCFSDTAIGASFRTAFEANIAPWSQHIEVREGDARDWGWNGEPIEILFLDMVKTWEMNDLVLETFMRFLIPGHSIIIQQDYLWGYGPWIHMTMELLAPSVTILDSMPHGSVAYFLNEAIPPEMLGAKLRAALPLARQRILMDRAVQRWHGEEQGMVELARVMLIAESCGQEAARTELAEVLRRHTGEERVEQCAAIVAGNISDEPRV